MKLHNLLCVVLSLAFAGCASLPPTQDKPAASGPKISILGDSYSTFEGAIPKGNAIFYRKPPKAFHGVEKPEDCWWGLVATKLGGKIERNESWSGSTICNTGYDGSDASKCSFVARAGRLGDPDIILICGATNDSWAGSPIGDFRYANWTPEELKAFRPAMAKMLADIAVGYPKAKVWFILNIGLSQTINDSAHQICRHYGVSCIDLKKFDQQKGHPTAQGMREIAEQVMAEIGKL